MIGQLVFYRGYSYQFEGYMGYAVFSPQGEYLGMRKNPKQFIDLQFLKG